VVEVPVTGAAVTELAADEDWEEETAVEVDDGYEESLAEVEVATALVKKIGAVLVVVEVVEATALVLQLWKKRHSQA